MNHLTTETDCLVIGGGTAGGIAAIAAAREGARTLLIERGSQLGGVTTTGGVSFPGLFHAWGRQVIAGIGWDLVKETVRLNGGTLPDFSTPPRRHWMHQVRLHGGLYAMLAEEAALAAGVEIAYYEFPQSVTPLEGGGWQVECCGFGSRRTVFCRQLIDCTGGAEAVAMAGFERMREAEAQPGTLIFRLEGYGAFDEEEVQRHYLAALADGRLVPGDFSSKNAPFVHFLSSRGENCQHLFGLDNSTCVGQSAANIAGRASLLRLLRFIQSLPGGEGGRIASVQQETALRETYRIVGMTVITVEDYVQGRMEHDAVCHSFYPIDLHDRDGVRPEPLAQGVVPSVPLRALIPRKSRDLLVAGRCVSSDRLANSALRVQASSMAMGQAVGTAAALAIRKGVTPCEVPWAQLVARLEAGGAIVPAAALAERS